MLIWTIYRLFDYWLHFCTLPGSVRFQSPHSSPLKRACQWHTMNNEWLLLITLIYTQDHICPHLVESWRRHSVNWRVRVAPKNFHLFVSPSLVRSSNMTSAVRGAVIGGPVSGSEALTVDSSALRWCNLLACWWRRCDRAALRSSFVWSRRDVVGNRHCWQWVIQALCAAVRR